MTDEQLIEQILVGEILYFSQLVEKYRILVFNTCFGFLRNKEEAEDITQEVFLEVFQSLSHFRNESRFSTWLYRISINKSLNQVKKNRRRGIFESIEKAVFLQKAEKHCLENLEIERSESNEILKKAVNSLPESQRIAFTLHKIDEMSHSSISEIMGLSVSAVESLIHRAKKRLKEKLIRMYQDK